MRTKNPVRAKPKNNLVFKETCGLWKHKTSLQGKDSFCAKLAKKCCVKGEKLQAACDICYIQFCMFSLKSKCFVERETLGQFGLL